MIQDCEKLINHISSWIIEQVKLSNKTHLIVNVSGGINSTVAAFLCFKTNIPTLCVHGDFDAVLTDTVKLIFSKQRLAIVCSNGFDPDFEKISNPDELEIFRSSLVQAYSLYYTENKNGLLVSTTNKTKSNIVRCHRKYSDRGDIYPLADLFVGEVKQLVDVLIPASIRQYLPDHFVSELHPNKPEYQTRLALTFDEIEWANREHDRHMILALENPSEQFSLWYKYFLRQKEVISRVHQLNRTTFDKQLIGPICYLRDLKGIIQ